MTWASDGSRAISSCKEPQIEATEFLLIAATYTAAILLYSVAGISGITLSLGKEPIAPTSRCTYLSLRVIGCTETSVIHRQGWCFVGVLFVFWLFQMKRFQAHFRVSRHKPTIWRKHWLHNWVILCSWRNKWQFWPFCILISNSKEYF